MKELGTKDMEIKNEAHFEWELNGVIPVPPPVFSAITVYYPEPSANIEKTSKSKSPDLINIKNGVDLKYDININKGDKSEKGKGFGETRFNKLVVWDLGIFKNPKANETNTDKDMETKAQIKSIEIHRGETPIERWEKMFPNDNLGNLKVYGFSEQNSEINEALLVDENSVSVVTKILMVVKSLRQRNTLKLHLAKGQNHLQ